MQRASTSALTCDSWLSPASCSRQSYLSSQNSTNSFTSSVITTMGMGVLSAGIVFVGPTEGSQSLVPASRSSTEFSRVANANSVDTISAMAPPRSSGPRIAFRSR